MLHGARSRMSFRNQRGGGGAGAVWFTGEREGGGGAPVGLGAMGRAGGAGTPDTWLTPKCITNCLTRVFEATKTCPPASAGVLNRLIPNDAL